MKQQTRHSPFDTAAARSGQLRRSVQWGGEWRVLSIGGSTRHSPLTTRHYPRSLRSWILLAALTFAGALVAQRIDSIPDYLAAPPSLIVKLDMRGSFIGNESVRFAGIKLGLEHAGKVQYGIGYSFLLSPVEGSAQVEGLGEVGTRLRFGYVTPYFEFAFYQKNNWELRIPVQFGIGSGSVVYEDAEGRKRKLQKSGVFLYEPSMTVQYRFLKYFAVGGGWGYRLVLRSAPLADGLTAPIYTFGLRVFFGDLWRDIKPKD